VVVGTAAGDVVAVDAETGAQRWSVSTRGAITTNIAIADGIVYAGSQDTSLYALDLTSGAELWKQTMGAQIMSSPAVADGVVVSGSRGTEVRGFAAASGEQLWSLSMGSSWADASVHIDNGTAYFGSSAAGQVVGADLHTGAEVWRSSVGGWPWARPTADGLTVYATTGRTSDHEPWDAAVYALDRDTGTIVWSAATGPALDWRPAGASYGAMTSPALTERLVIVSGLDGVLYAFAR